MEAEQKKPAYAGPGERPVRPLRDEVARLWRTGRDGQRLLTEVRRSAYANQDAFQAALDFHYGRGCEDEYLAA